MRANKRIVLFYLSEKYAKIRKNNLKVKLKSCTLLPWKN